MKKRSFVARIPELLALEGNYGAFELSCRHRDILRCSVTRHFTSCYRPGSLLSSTPIEACSNPNVAILFDRDRSGQFLWRAFVVFKVNGHGIHVGKMYGNPPEAIGQIIKDSFIKISPDIYVQDVNEDLDSL